MSISSTRKYILNLCIICFTLVLSACGGASSSPGGSGGGSSSNVALSLAAPTQFPAGQPQPINITLTMTNTSNVNATNLVYSVPSSTNYTGVDITINPTGISGNNCTNIAAGASCVFTATIAANANPGSFTVVATPDAATTSRLQKVAKVATSNSISVTANLALVSIPNNTPNYQFYVLPVGQTVNQNSDGTATAQVSIFVESTASAFTSIQLVDSLGNPLNATLVGELATAPYSVNTYQVTIPSGTAVQNIQALSNACTTLFPAQNACSNNTQVTVAVNGTGILQIQPNSFNMSPSYTSQVVTLNNIGTAAISGIDYSGIASPFSISSSQNTCGATLAAGASCAFTLTYTPSTGSGQASFLLGYNNGIASSNSSVTIPYAGTSGSPYAIVNANPSTLTLNSANTQETITLTNVGTAVANTINVPSSLPSGLVLVGNNCGVSLNIGASCSYTIGYGSGTTNAGSGILAFTYNNGTASQTTNVGASWATYTTPTPPVPPVHLQHFAYITDTGTNAVWVYQVESTTGELTSSNESVPVPSGVNSWQPQYAAIGGNYLYVLNESSGGTHGGIYQYLVESTTGAATYIGQAPQPSAGITESGYYPFYMASNGQYAYVIGFYQTIPNNYYSSVSQYNVNQTTGALSYVGQLNSYPTGFDYQTFSVYQVSLYNNTVYFSPFGVGPSSVLSTFEYTIGSHGTLTYSNTLASNPIPGNTKWAPGCFTLNGQYAYICGDAPDTSEATYGANTWQYTFSNNMLTSPESSPIPAGTTQDQWTPQGIVINNNFAYVPATGVGANSVYTYQINNSDGSLTLATPESATAPNNITWIPTGISFY